LFRAFPARRLRYCWKERQWKR